MSRKILHIITCLDIGGAEMMLKKLIEQELLGSNEHNVVSLTSLGKVGKALQEKGVNVYPLYMSSTKDCLKILNDLKKIIIKLQPEIIQTWMYHADLLGGIAARLAGNKNIIWGIRQTSFEVSDNRLTYYLMRLLAKLSYFIPKKILCCAEAAKKSHIAYGYDSRKMCVINNGFELEKIEAGKFQRDEIRDKLGIFPYQKVIGIIGRFNPQKDHHNFVQAAGILSQKFPDVRFMMIGKNLNNSNFELMNWIHSSGYVHNFYLLDEQSNVPDYLAAMDIFCLSSSHEGFPNVVGEAMASGLPCVVTDVGDSSVLVKDTGIIVPARDSNALAAGLLQLLNLQKTQFEKLSCMAKKRIQENFTMPKIQEQFNLLYDEILFDEG